MRKTHLANLCITKSTRNFTIETPNPSKPTNLITSTTLDPSRFLNTSYDKYISEEECQQVVHHALKVIHGPIFPCKRRKREKLFHQGVSHSNPPPKSLLKWCCTVIAKDIQEYIHENQASITALPLHLKEILIKQVSKAYQMNDVCLGLFFDTGYQTVNFQNAHLSYDILNKFLSFSTGSSHIISDKCLNNVTHLNIAYSNIEATWFLALLPQYLTDLTYLNISGCFDGRYGRKVVHTMTSHLKKLEFLNISGVVWLTNSVILECVDWSHELLNLKILTIERCPRMDAIYVHDQIRKIRPEVHVQI
ncbi:hypothetical protein K7432_005208 [Basidiobolus ranarum]|uniref:Mitochondrial ATP synthase regulatory component factor B n=1 Tax=Basidiobolus ranarum TaxID=34480 RepID=A0ABR2WWZ0_9FUNG